MTVITNDKEIASLDAKAITSNEAAEFFPKGAIAFFVSLIIGFAFIWTGVYLLMLHRQFHL